MLHLYDTRTRTAQDISPMDGKTLRFYCCGPTVYGPAHIGNFRTFVMQDVFRRVLELGGVPTTHIRNLTDVDDKTIRDSQKAGVSLAEFTAGWADLFHRDCAALNCLPPHANPPPWAIFPNKYGWFKHWWKRAMPMYRKTVPCISEFLPSRNTEGFPTWTNVNWI